METEGSLEEGSELFEIDVGDGKTLYVEVRPGDTIRNLRERLMDAGVTMDLAQDNCPLDEGTNALAYFSALSNAGTSREEETIMLSEESAIACEALVSQFEEQVDTFCSVSGCPINKAEYPDVALFKFPAQSKRCMDWLDAVGRSDLASMPISQLCRKEAVCANHFADAQFVNSERKILKATAVPIIFKEEHNTTKRYETNKSLEDSLPVMTFKNEPIDVADEILIKEQVIEEDSSVHPGSLCRLCAKPILTAPIFIFKSDDNGNAISDTINNCLPMVVKKTDNLPKQICEVCSQHLSLQNSFVESCLKAEQKLQTLSQRFSVHGLKMPVLVSNNTNRRSKNVQKAYCCPLCCNGAMRYMQKAHPYPASPPPSDVINGLYSDDDAEEEHEGTPLLYTPDDLALLVFECDICEEVLPDSFTSLDHCKLHSAENYFPCVVCGVVFSTQDELNDHFTLHAVAMSASKKPVWRPLLECGTCNLQFTIKKDFILHKCASPILRTLRDSTPDVVCQPCNRTFTNVTRAEAHKKGHDPTHTHHCPHCNYQAETSKILDDHVMLTHQAPTVDKCAECDAQFVSETHLEKHLKVHQAVSYQCSVCETSFASLLLIQKHIREHGVETEVETNDLNEYRCSKCSLTFTHRSLLQHHLEVTHDTIKRMPSLIQYQCKLCGERITNSSEVLVHRTVHFKGTDPYICEYCGEANASPNALARHRRFLHPDERPYVCSICDAATRTLYEARVHRKTHTCPKLGQAPAPQKVESKIYQCQQCPSLFSDKVSFLAHKKSHKVAKWFNCDRCDKSFPERHRLNVHKRQHTGEKPFACGTCGKKFAQTSAMYTHALLHTGETPHECDLCGRKFRIKSDRDNHRRTHTGEKPYKCQYCSKTFRTGQVYYQHRMIHTGERRFPCDICGRAFKRSHTLVCHRRIHTGEKPNMCDICGKGFRQRTDMRKHKINLHNVPA